MPNDQRPTMPNDLQNPLTLMIAGGGTGGHIYPGIAIARGFVQRDETRRVVFVGTERGLETKIVPAEGFSLELISVGGLKGKSLAEFARNLLKLPLAFVLSWRLLSRIRPAAVLGVGGYASGPILLVAALRGYPTMIQEQNAFPGITNRILAKLVRRVATAFPEALERLGRKGIVTGNPVRAEFFAISPEGRTSGRTRILIFGGSQGSRAINDAMVEALPHLADLRDDVDIVHQTGPRQHEAVSAAYAQSAFAQARVVEYLDEMAVEMKRADFAVCRAGALTIGELAAVGLASILIPFAQASDNHQEVNARAVESAGGAIVITEKQLDGQLLAETIRSLVKDRERLSGMGRGVARLGAPGATGALVDAIEGIAGIGTRKN